MFKWVARWQDSILDKLTDKVIQKLTARHQPDWFEKLPDDTRFDGRSRFTVQDVARIKMSNPRTGSKKRKRYWDKG